MLIILITLNVVIEKGIMKKQLAVFSFFTGAGFLDLGFEKAGFKTMMANEIDPDFSRVYLYSRKVMRMALPKFGLQTGDVCCYLKDDVKRKELAKRVRETKKENALVGFIGGPPCPDFSIAGKQAGSTGKNGRLSQVYVDLICANNPDFFVFENVKGLWKTAKHRAFFDSIVRQLQTNNYAVDYRLINALEYGAPQDRERIILIGVKINRCVGHVDSESGHIMDFPWQQFIKYKMGKVRAANWPTTNAFEENTSRAMPMDIIPELTVEHWFEKNNVSNHPNASDFFVPRAGLAKMQIVAEGDDSKKCFKRLHRWRYSPTAAYGNNEVHLHPYKARRMSVAETLAIQSLPKRFVLPSDISLSSKFKTIGNGVPYVAALGIAKTLKKFLTEL
jgi:DNA (cytosine-5)-methyltransferase 1